MPGEAVVDMKVKVKGLEKDPQVLREALETAVKGISLGANETITVDNYSAEDETAVQ